VTFREADSKQSGMTRAHDNSMSPQRYLPETDLPGVANFDYNKELIPHCVDAEGAYVD